MARAVASPVRQLDIEPPYLVVVPGLTEKDFYKLTDEDSNWEYLDGRIVTHSPASDRHEDLFRFLLTLLNYYVPKSSRDATISEQQKRFASSSTPAAHKLQQASGT